MTLLTNVQVLVVREGYMFELRAPVQKDRTRVLLVAIRTEWERK
jgi:hypothetical protein